jgi:FkbM family methyltransferase
MHPGKRWIWRHVFQEHLAWRGQDALARTVFGAQMAVSTQDLIQRYIYHYGVWEPSFTRWLSERLRAGDTFVDVGANVGYFTLLGSQRVGASGRVVALEPSPTTFAALQANVARNGASNVRLLQLAASDREGELSLSSGPESNSGMASTHAATADGGARVRARPLTECLSDQELSTTRAIKIDVEGAEWDALMGLEPALPKLPRGCSIIVEVSPERLRARGHSAQALFELMSKHGFSALELSNDYDPEAYFAPRLTAPRAISGPPSTDADIIFTRV